MAKVGMAKIREAVRANRGGHNETSDAGIMFIWNSLGDETRKQYLDVLEAQSHKGTKAQSKDAGEPPATREK